MNISLVHSSQAYGVARLLVVLLLALPASNLDAQVTTVAEAVSIPDPDTQQVHTELFFTAARRPVDESVDRNWQNIPKVGSTVGVLLRGREGSLLEVEPGGCELLSFIDDKGVDLKSEPQSSLPGRRSCSYSTSTLGKQGNLGYVEFHAPDAPSAGATWVEVRSEASVWVSDPKVSSRVEDFRLEHRRQYTVGGARIAIQDGAQMPPPEAAVTTLNGIPLPSHLQPVETDGFLLTVDEFQARLVSLRLVAADGSDTIEAKLKQIRTSQGQRSSLYTLERPFGGRGYTLEVEVYPNRRSLKVPIELRAPLAGFGGPS